MEKRVIRLFGEFDNAVSDAFFSEFERLDAKRHGRLITILLNSPGGDEDEGWAIYDCIKQSRNPVRIIVYGQAHSMAAAVLQAASHNQRLMTPNSSFMMHPGWREYEESPHMAKVIAEGEWAKVANGKYIDAIAERAKCGINGTIEAFEEEKYLTAQQAVELGFADAIHTGAIP